ncbi:hypothetical protein KBY83_07685 [Cyanobium sp. WKJ7-Wakatipu]|nr:hypothetical protein [Cyanobium sp. WKJ7-Wakatipu]
MAASAAGGAAGSLSPG